MKKSGEEERQKPMQTGKTMSGRKGQSYSRVEDLEGERDKNRKGPAKETKVTKNINKDSRTKVSPQNRPVQPRTKITQRRRRATDEVILHWESEQSTSSKASQIDPAEKTNPVETKTLEGTKKSLRSFPRRGKDEIQHE